MSEIVSHDTTIVVGIDPYGDESGYSVTVTVERKSGDTLIQIEETGTTVSLTVSQWRGVAAAVEYALKAVEPSP